MQEFQESGAPCAGQNALLRKKLDGIRSEVMAQMNNMVSSMFDVDPEDVLSDEEIRLYLTEAFNKYDKNRSGQLG